MISLVLRRASRLARLSLTNFTGNPLIGSQSIDTHQGSIPHVLHHIAKYPTPPGEPYFLSRTFESS